MKPQEIVVGQSVRVAQREAVVRGLPVLVGAKWYALVEYKSGIRDEVPLAILSHALKRPSVPRVALTTIVAGYNANVPVEMQITREAVERLMLKAGVK